MTKHEMLYKSLLDNGKTKTWEYYGKEYGMSAESARAVWKKVRKAKNIVLSKTREQLAEHFAKEVGLVIVDKENVEAQNYIAELESTLVAYSENAKEGTASKTVISPEEITS